MTGARDRLARGVQIERYRLREACRDILEGPDTPGRRWLVAYVRGEGVGGPPESLALAASDYFDTLMCPIRKQLIADYPDLFDPLNRRKEPDHGKHNRQERESRE